jgi:hypothetical protein
MRGHAELPEAPAKAEAAQMHLPEFGIEAVYTESLVGFLARSGVDRLCTQNIPRPAEQHHHGGSG